MIAGSLGILLLAGTLTGQVPENYYTAATGAARELSAALDLLQRSFATLPVRPEGRGLYGQLDTIQLDQMYFRQQLQRKAARDNLYVAFDKVDGELNQILGDLQGFEKWDPAIRMAARRVRSAQHDVHVALSAGDAAPVRVSQAAYRQTLALQTRVEDLERLVRYVFNEQDALSAWQADFASLREAVAELQRLQKIKTAGDDLKQQFTRTDQVWERLVGRYRNLPEGQHLLLRAEFGQVDQAFARLAVMLGVPGRRAPLPYDAY